MKLHRAVSKDDDRMDAGDDGALSHIRICDFTGQLAGAGATKVLAAFGAQVIRIENPVATGPDDAIEFIG